MSETMSLDTQIYPVNPQANLSMQDLLDYFRKQGSTRVSDLHLKVGCPPTYRFDGWLTPTKGAALDEDSATYSGGIGYGASGELQQQVKYFFWSLRFRCASWASGSSHPIPWGNALRTDR